MAWPAPPAAGAWAAGHDHPRYEDHRLSSRLSPGTRPSPGTWEALTATQRCIWTTGKARPIKPANSPQGCGTAGRELGG